MLLDPVCIEFFRGVSGRLQVKWSLIVSKMRVFYFIMLFAALRRAFPDFSVAGSDTPDAGNRNLPAASPHSVHEGRQDCIQKRGREEILFPPSCRRAVYET